jgi:hypothetical protein
MDADPRDEVMGEQEEGLEEDKGIMGTGWLHQEEVMVVV